MIHIDSPRFHLIHDLGGQKLIMKQQHKFSKKTTLLSINFAPCLVY